MTVRIRLLVGLVWGAVVLTGGCAPNDLPEGGLMRVKLTTDGGFGAFPGLARPVSLDEHDLSPDQRIELDKLVNAARAEADNAKPRALKPVADGRTYRIDVDAGDTLHISAADPAVPPAFALLMDFVKRHGHR